jgi:hypothetical protein
MTTIKTLRKIPPRWIILTVAGISGDGGLPSAGGVEVSSIMRWTALR